LKIDSKPGRLDVDGKDEVMVRKGSNQGCLPEFSADHLSGNLLEWENLREK